jgi:hypothetical protein
MELGPKGYFFWIIIIIIVIFIMWLFWGGNKEIEPLGIQPFVDLGIPLSFPPQLIPDRSARSPASERHIFIAESPKSQTEVSVRSFDSESSVTESESDSESSVVSHCTVNDTRRFKSIGEELTCKAFEKIIGRRVKNNYRPDFLKNPETGRNLEYDCYDSIDKIAIEYNGSQHYRYTPRFHKTEQSFHDQVYRDDLKLKLSKKSGIMLIRVPYTVDVCNKNGKYDSRITKDERYRRIKSYLHSVLK